MWKQTDESYFLDANEERIEARVNDKLVCFVFGAWIKGVCLHVSMNHDQARRLYYQLKCIFDSIEVEPKEVGIA